MLTWNTSDLIDVSKGASLEAAKRCRQLALNRAERAEYEQAAAAYRLVAKDIAAAFGLDESEDHHANSND